MKKLFAFLLLLFVNTAQAQKTDKDLQKQIDDLVKGFHGTVGIFVHDMKKDRIAGFNADTLFPTASIVKIPIMIGIMSKIQAKELDFHQVMIYEDTLNYDHGEDILASFKPGEKIQLSKLMLLSISLSDNTASLMLQGIAGGGLRINQIMDSSRLCIYSCEQPHTGSRNKPRNIWMGTNHTPGDSPPDGTDSRKEKF